MPATIAPTLPDSFLDLADRDVQYQAARLVQESFATALRLSESTEGKPLELSLARLGGHLREWSQLCASESSFLRVSLLLYGLDQWGLAYAKVFGAQTLQGVSMLIADLRGGLDLFAEGSCQRYLDSLREDEGNGLDFKIAMRRELHLSLWHSMIVAETREQGEAILNLLGGLLLALDKAMPNIGWRLLADTLASIQIRCLQHGLAVDGLAKEFTEALFAGLSRDLPDMHKQNIFAYSAQAVRDWQEARHATQH